MAIYCNILKHNTQYGIDLYCFTPSAVTLINDCFIRVFYNQHCQTFSDLVVTLTEITKLNISLILMA